MAKEKKPAEKQKKAAPKAGEKAPVIETPKVEEVHDTVMMLPNDQNFKGMSQDSKVKYADLLQRRYVEHPADGAAYTPEFIGGINTIIDATVLSIAIDEAVCGSGSLAYIIKKNPTCYGGLVNMAKRMGIENLPAFSALPTPTEAQLKAAGFEGVAADEHVVVNITEKNVSKETKKEAKKEHEIAEKQVELDGTKIEDENGLIEAIQHRLVKDKSSTYKNLIDVVYVTLKPFRLAKATSDEEKAKYDSMSLYDWLMDAFSLVSPTIVYKGIGKGMVTVTKFAKTPIRAFIIGRASTMDRNQVKEGHPNPGLKDEESAQMVKAVINWICKTDVKRLEAELVEEKDAKKVESINKEIADLKEVLDVTNNPSMTFVDEMLDNLASDKIAATVYNDILGSYFGNPYRAENEKEPLSKKYKNIDFCVQQIAGSIVNLFTTSTQQDDRYSFDNGFQELVEYTAEEIQANKKAELEAKSKKA